MTVFFTNHFGFFLAVCLCEEGKYKCHNAKSPKKKKKTQQIDGLKYMGKSLYEQFPTKMQKWLVKTSKKSTSSEVFL
jgi:hypothetical protein